MNTRARIERLERAGNAKGKRLIIAIPRDGETEAEAVARCGREQGAATTGTRLIILDEDDLNL